MVKDLTAELLATIEAQNKLLKDIYENAPEAFSSQYLNAHMTLQAALRRESFWGWVRSNISGLTGLLTIIGALAGGGKFLLDQSKLVDNNIIENQFKVFDRYRTAFPAPTDAEAVNTAKAACGQQDYNQRYDYARIIAKMGNINEKQLAQFVKDGDFKPVVILGVALPPKTNYLPTLKIIVDDLRQWNLLCAADINPAQAEASSSYTAPLSTAMTSEAATPAASVQDTIVYIQYQSGDDSKTLANDLLTDVGAIQGYQTPGVQRVAAVPKVDQIRIYSPSGKQSAQTLQKSVASLRDAQIIDFSKVYPNAPSNVIEIWLHTRPGATPGASSSAADGKK